MRNFAALNLLLAAALLLAAGASLAKEPRLEIALTFDDLPLNGAKPANRSMQQIAADTVAVLTFLESHAAEAGHRDVGFWLPSANREAIAHFLGRGFRIDPFVATYFSDHPGMALDRYLITAPPFFV